MSTNAPTPHSTPTGAVRPAGGGSVGHLLDKIPGQWMAAGIVILLFIGAAMELEHKRKTRNSPKAIGRAVAKSVNRSMNRTRGQQQDAAVARAFSAVFGLLWRFVTGRELSGRPASNASFLRRGRRPLSHLLRRDPAAVQLGTVAIPERPLPAAPAGPSAAVERWRGWQVQHPVPGALNGAVRHGGTAAVWIATTGRASARGIGQAAGDLRRVLRAWGTWPHACRALLRLAVLAALLGLWLHRVDTELALTGVLAAGLVLAATGPAGLALWRGVPRGDDHIYGPRLWAALRVVLDLREEEYHDAHMLMPADLSAEGAEIRLLLPDHYAATDLEKQQLDHLVNTRVPGEWTGRFHMMAAPPVAVWTHKPKPKPKPSCPDFVDFFDPEIQAAIRACAKGEVVVGRDDTNTIRTRRFGGETGHWGLSVGSGGGKSAFNSVTIVQLVAQGYHIVIVDVKRISLAAFIGVPGVHIYNDPMAAQDMRRAINWVVDEMEARSAVMEVQPTADFPGLLCIIEEGNECAIILRAWWDAHRKPTTDKEGPADPAADRIWERVTSGARLGRQMFANFLLVGQDFRDQAYGGKGMRNAFPLKFIGNFTPQSWKNVVDITPVPDSYTKAGRMMMVEGSTVQGWIQTPYGDPEALRAWAIAERQRQGFDPAAGLFGAPPERSPRELPKLLRSASRDTLPQSVWEALEGGSEDSDAGDAVTSRSHDAARDTLIPGQRDSASQPPADAPAPDVVGIYTDASGRRRVAGLEAASASWRDEDAAPPPARSAAEVVSYVHQLLTLAEIARYFEETNVPITNDTMRQHKHRRKEGHARPFPTGTEDGDKTLYTIHEMRDYYQPEILAHWRGQAGENGD